MNKFEILFISSVFIRASGWLLFNANSAIFQLYHGDNTLIINEMMMKSTVHYINTLSLIFLVLADWNNNPRIDMSLHSDTISCFLANQSLLFLLNATCLAEKQQIPIFDLTRSGLEPTIYRTRDEHATSPMRLSSLEIDRRVLIIYLINFSSSLFMSYKYFIKIKFK